MQAQKSSVDTAEQSHRVQSTTAISPHSAPHVHAGTKRPREPDNPVPTDYYKLPGMSDLTERELKQNEILSKRYQKK